MPTKSSENFPKTDTIGGRLRAARKTLGLTLVQLSDKILISHGSISDIENDKTKPAAETLANLVRNTEINVEWLLTGQGSPLKTSPKIAPEININVTPRVFMAGERVEPPSQRELEDDYLAVPLVEGTIAAGHGRIVREDIHSFVWVYKPEIGERYNLTAVQIGRGETSMLPTLHPGSIVIIDLNDKEVHKNGIYAVRLGDDLCSIKRIHLLNDGIILTSDNHNFPVIKPETQDLDLLIIGRVIWAWRSLIK